MKWKLRALGAAVVLGVAVAISIFEHRLAVDDPVIAFASTHEAFASVKAAGFCCTADNPGGRIDNGFLVSRMEFQWQAIFLMHKGIFSASEWKGKVWFARRTASARLQDAVPDGAGVRVWGNVIAFGDADFLDELERALKKLERV